MEAQSRSFDMAGIAVRHLIADSFMWRVMPVKASPESRSGKLSTLMNTQHNSVYVELHINGRVDTKRDVWNMAGDIGK